MRLLWLLAFLLLAVPALAQDTGTLRPGYVVTAAGDTLRGALAVPSKTAQTNRVTLHGAADSVASRTAPTAFTPETAVAYGYDGGVRFVARTVLTDVDGSQQRTAFLRVLVDGPRALYELPRVNDRSLFFVEGDAFPIEGLFEVTRTSERVLTGTRTYRIARWTGTLTRATQDCRPLLNEVPELELREPSLVRYLVRYNACVEPGYVHTEVGDTGLGRRYAFHFSVEGSLGTDQFAPSELFVQPDETATSLLLALRGSVLIEVLSAPERMYLVGELNLQRHGRHEAPVSQVEDFAYEFAPIYALLGLGGQYELGSRPLRPFVRGMFLTGRAVAGTRGLLGDRAPFGNDIEVRAAGGWALAGGVVWARATGRSLTLGLRGEWLTGTRSFYTPFAESVITHRSLSTVLGVRF